MPVWLVTAAFITHDKALSLACIIASGVSGAVCLGPIYAAVQAMSNAATRATVAAMLGIFTTLLGQSVGPGLVGVISDAMARSHHADSLHMSLEITSLLGIWPAIHVFRLAQASTIRPPEARQVDAGLPPVVPEPSKFSPIVR